MPQRRLQLSIRERSIRDLRESLPLGSRCCVLGTLGRFMAHSSFPSGACSLLSRGILRLDNRDSAPALFWPALSFDLGVPTVFTAGVVIFAGPSFGGIGGLEDD
jgi:hypothetical protein